MAVKQLSVFLENKKGKLSDAVKILSDASINIRAMSIADTQDFGILRMIVSDADLAKELLMSDTIVSETEVIAVKMDDKEGALYKVLAVLEAASINVDYAYAFTAKGNQGAYVVFRVDDVKAAEDVLTSNSFVSISEDDMKLL